MHQVVSAGFSDASFVIAESEPDWLKKIAGLFPEGKNEVFAQDDAYLF
jgi:cell wall assembly regulator SMI1